MNPVILLCSRQMGHAAATQRPLAILNGSRRYINGALLQEWSAFSSRKLLMSAEWKPAAQTVRRFPNQAVAAAWSLRQEFRSSNSLRKCHERKMRETSEEDGKDMALEETRRLCRISSLHSSHVVTPVNMRRHDN